MSRVFKACARSEGCFARVFKNSWDFGLPKTQTLNPRFLTRCHHDSILTGTQTMQSETTPDAQKYCQRYCAFAARISGAAAFTCCISPTLWTSSRSTTTLVDMPHSFMTGLSRDDTPGQGLVRRNSIFNEFARKNDVDACNVSQFQHDFGFCTLPYKLPSPRNCIRSSPIR